MLALAMGLVAALAWGVHDLCVRSVSRRADIAPCLLGVFAVGLALMLPFGAWRAMTAGAAAAASPAVPAASGFAAFLTGSGALSGLAVGALFAAANYALYRAFAAGPVRIVAPITAAYPVVTVGLATLAGQSVGAGAWVAVPAVILGIAMVASGARESEAAYDRRAAIAWSAAAAIGYASTFAFGQHLSAAGGAFEVLVVTRAVALAAVALAMLSAGGLRWPPRDTWAAIALMASMDALALGLVFAAGALPDAAFATVTASMFGIVTIVLARVVFGETLVARQWAGVAVAFAAIGWLAA